MTRNRNNRKQSLRCGFATGTAAAAATRVALETLIHRKSPAIVPIRLLIGRWIGIPVHDVRTGTGNNGLRHSAREAQWGFQTPDAVVLFPNGVGSSPGFVTHCTPAGRSPAGSPDDLFSHEAGMIIKKRRGPGDNCPRNGHPAYSGETGTGRQQGN